MRSAKEQMFAAEFARRRKIFVRIAGPSWFVLAVAATLKIAGLEVPMWVLGVMFGIGGVGHLLSARISKYPHCPRCDSRVIPGEGWFPRRTKCQVCNLHLDP